MPDDPSGGPPSVFKPATFARHADAVEYVEGLTRTRAPRPGTERFPGLAPGAWGLLAAGGVITGATGTRLGTGTITLCDRDGVPLEDSPLNVYNAGAEIAAGTPYDDPYGYYDDSYDSGDRIVALEWVGGYWTACGCIGVHHARCVLECTPCPVPRTDLTCDYSLTSGAVTGTVTLAYDGRSTWSACKHIGGAYYRFELICGGSGSAAIFSVGTYSSADCIASGFTGAACSSTNSPPSGFNLGAHACEPFSVTYESPDYGICQYFGQCSVRITGPASGTFPCCFICVTVTSGCGVVFPAGAIVTATLGGDTYHCTVGSDGKCCMPVRSSGTYNVSVAKSPYTGSNKDVSVVCDGTTDVALTLSEASKGGRFNANGCPDGGGGLQRLPGAICKINGGTYITGPSGTVDFSAPIGTYNWTISCDRFVSQSGTVTINCSFLAQIGATLVPAAGYHCSPCGCVYPLKAVLNFTDSVLGATLLTSSGGLWQGSISYNFPGYCTCPQRFAVLVEFQTSGCDMNVRYKQTPLNGSFTCPDPTGFASYGIARPLALTCPQAFFATGSPVPPWSSLCAGGPPPVCSTWCLYQGQTPVWTLTE